MAQTNLQLLAQLHDSGRDAPCLARIHSAYWTMIELFAGRYRGNGRPFPNHLVGAASIAAGLGLTDEAIVATLLHAAYEQGRFPSGWQGATGTNRHYLRGRIGVAPEELVHAYQTFEWTTDSIRAMTESDTLSATARIVAVMRLSDLLDDLLDAGCVSTPGKFDPPARERIDSARALAEKLGLPGLAAKIAAGVRANESASYIAAAVGGQRNSFTIPTHPQRRSLRSLASAAVGRLFRPVSRSTRNRS